MPLVTRPEELIMLAIWQLKENAYCVPIRRLISEITREKWSLGSVYMPLDRLVKKGYLTSYLSDATRERGGRQKRIYRLTPDGTKALMKVREVQRAMWSIMPKLSTKS